jgi:uncharacterized protein DUF2800
MLQPSNADLWVRCPLAGNVLSSGQYHATHNPHAVEGDARREGTCAHWTAEAVLTNHAETCAELIGQVHPNGWVVDEEMARHVQAYVDYVRGFGSVTTAERIINLWGIVRGRLDTHSSAGSTIRIFDFKYGYRLVEAEENYPMLCYGLGVVEYMPYDVDIELHVYQPRPHHPDGPARVWRIHRTDIIGLAMWLYDRAQACFNEPKGQPGPHCVDCPANRSCHALAATNYYQTSVIQDDRMTSHTAAELARKLQFLRLAKILTDGALHAIEAEAEARMARGEYIPGHVMSANKGNRKFTVSPLQVQLATGINPYKLVEMTPAELEAKGVSRDILDTITTRPIISRKISADPEKVARRMFGKPVT